MKLTYYIPYPANYKLIRSVFTKKNKKEFLKSNQLVFHIDQKFSNLDIKYFFETAYPRCRVTQINRRAKMVGKKNHPKSFKRMVIKLKPEKKVILTKEHERPKFFDDLKRRVVIKRVCHHLVEIKNKRKKIWNIPPLQLLLTFNAISNSFAQACLARLV